MVPQARRRLARKVRPPASLLVRVPDGRSIAIEEYGDPAGPAVLYFHGWPACRLEAGLIPDLPVRLLSFDRPGYGRSSPQPGRTLLDWPKDVAEVADRLGLERFHIVGLSGGAPYGAACAHALPHRVRGLALVSPVPPAAGVDPRAPGVGHLFLLGRHPMLARRMFAMLRPLLQRRMITPSTLFGTSLQAADRASLTEAVAAGLARVWREGMGRGVHGAISDAEIYAKNWGFPLDAIRAPAAIWFGGQDSLIPRSALAPFETIPGARLHMLPDEGHYSLPLRHAAAILRDLVDAPDQLSSSLSQ